MTICPCESDACLHGEVRTDVAFILNYFESRDDLVVSYVRYTKDFMTEKCKAWFQEHDRGIMRATWRT